MRHAPLVVLLSLAASTAAGDVLLDNGIRVIDHQVAGIYHTVSADFVDGGLETYQPFEVGAQGWRIDSMRLFGREPDTTSFDVNAIMHLTVHAWTGSPDTIGDAIVGAIVEFPEVSPPSVGEWLEVDLGGIELDAGAYVLRARAIDSFTYAWWHHGAEGPAAVGRRVSDGAVFPRGASAALQINGVTLPTPSGVIAMTMLLPMVSRRRR